MATPDTTELAGEKNLTIEQGATFEHLFTWCEYDAEASPSPIGAPFDLTGFKARMHIRKKFTSTVYYIELTTENGRIAITALEGKIHLYISAEDTADLAWNGTAYYDLELYDDGTSPVYVKRLVQGTVTLSKEATK